MRNFYLKGQSTKTHQGVDKRQSGGGYRLIKLVRDWRTHALSRLAGDQMDAEQAVAGRQGRACALAAIGERKDLRRLCQSQSMRSRGREGVRARMEQMEADKKGARAEARQKTRTPHRVQQPHRSVGGQQHTTGKTSDGMSPSCVRNDLNITQYVANVYNTF